MLIGKQPQRNSNYSLGKCVFLTLLHLFQRFAIWLLSSGNGLLKINEATRAKIVKFSESMWKLTYYAAVEFCVLSVNYHESWFRDMKEYLRGWPNQDLK